MKVCLIRPPKIVPSNTIYGLGSFANSQSPSIGLAYIAAAIKNAGHHVMAVDCLGEGLFQLHKVSKFDAVVNGIDLDETIRRIPEDIEVIGITMMFSNEWFYYDALLDRLKKEFPQVKLVAGGEHISAEYHSVLTENTSLDFAVVGEGEETIIELLAAIDQKKDLRTIHGIAFCEDGKVVKTPSRKRIKRIDELPLPLWDVFPMDKYLNNNCSQSLENRRAIPILTQRGCPYSCTFCSNKDMWGTDYYLRNPESILSEIKLYVEKYKIEHLDFCDPVGVLNKKWIIELLTLLKDENLRITWQNPAGTRSEILDENILTLFKETGVQKISYAPESGSEEVLKRIKKRVNLSRLTQSMRIALKKDIIVRTHIMYGLPGQSLREVFQSLLFSLKLSLLGVHEVNVHLFTAYPGTQDYQNLLRDGSIDIEKIKRDGQYARFLNGQVIGRTGGVVSWSNQLPSWLLPKLQTFTYLMHFTVFYSLRPWNLLRNIYNAGIKRRPISSVENVMYRILYKSQTRFKKLPEIKGF